LIPIRTRNPNPVFVDDAIDVDVPAEPCFGEPRFKPLQRAGEKRVAFVFDVLHGCPHLRRVRSKCAGIKTLVFEVDLDRPDPIRAVEISGNSDFPPVKASLKNHPAVAAPCSARSAPLVVRFENVSHVAAIRLSPT